jgi:transcriptional regulator with XRE-family HTH domain
MTNFNQSFAQIAQYMKAIRRTRELTQHELATRLDVDPTYISRIENQRISTLPSIQFIQRLAHIGNDNPDVILPMVGYVDVKALRKRAGQSPELSILINCIADGTVTPDDAIQFVAELQGYEEE